MIHLQSKDFGMVDFGVKINPELNDPSTNPTTVQIPYFSASRTDTCGSPLTHGLTGLMDYIPSLSRRNLFSNLKSQMAHDV